MAERPAITNRRFTSRFKIMQDKFQGKCSSQKAAERLAFVSFPDNSIGAGLGNTWQVFIICAREFPDRHDVLIDVLLHLSQLPDEKDDQGEPLTIQGRRVWTDLPMFDLEMKFDWSALDVPAHPPDRRQTVIARFININKFAARLALTGNPAFSFCSWLALLTMRTAFETPTDNIRTMLPSEAFVPAAAAWIFILGSEMHYWDEEFKHGPSVGAPVKGGQFGGGTPGKGGQLWGGKPGFCVKRWELWRDRFGELAKESFLLSEDVRSRAIHAEERMRAIEEEAAFDEANPLYRCRRASA